MPTIFYSWQADTPTTTGRNLVHRALEDAVNMLSRDDDVEDAVRDDLKVDSDTKGVPGQASIVDTIFKKINAANVFVADMTFVGKRLDGRAMPNPNVAIEYGWALRALTHDRVITVMNVAHGHPTNDSMPFDLRHVRWPIRFECPDGADETARKYARRKLAKALKEEIATVLSEAPAAKEAAALFVPRAPAEGNARFARTQDQIGSMIFRGYGRKNLRPVHLREGGAMWLRLMPMIPLKSELSIGAMDDAVEKSSRPAVPLNHNERNSNLYELRSANSTGRCVIHRPDDELVLAVMNLFRNGEVWTIDTYLTQFGDAEDRFLFNKQEFVDGLRNCCAVLQGAGISGPYRWIAGIEGIQGKRIELENERFVRFPRDPMSTDVVMKSGSYAGAEEEAEAALSPFFSELSGHARCEI